ncbi:MAG TPA: LysR substrate-binding domain-containing protein, partial [Longimicrobiaceae bacterium]|nr:LysR substrate-binding domain-containing protein [Longimicrobiaceae bacterium]
RLDLAIVSRPVSGPGVRQLPLFEDELVAVAAPGHRWERLPFVGPEDFRDEHLILYTVPAEELTLFRDFLDPAGASPRKVSWMQLTEGIVELVRAGLGVTVMARWAVRPQLEAGTLRALPLGRGGIHREWSAVLAEPVPPYLLALVEAVAAHAIPALEPA